MENFSLRLVEIITAPSLEDATRLSMQTILHYVECKTACLLLWDHELVRYVIGETWIHPEHHVSPPEVRRHALSAAHPSEQPLFMNGVFYQPLALNNQHMGAFFCTQTESIPISQDYALLLKVLGQVFYTRSYLDRAEQEQAAAQATSERLSGLLRAVEQQQHTIDRLLAEEKQFSASLEAKVEERTLALQQAQERIVQSEKLAVIGQLASSLAHEINNPLQAIQSGLGLVIRDLQKGRDDRALGDLYTIQAELDRVETIFRQMLDFYRPTSSEYLPIALNEVCKSVAVLMRKRLEEASIQLRVNLTTSQPTTCGDRNQIKQVILNLILNAMEAGSSVIYLETGCTPTEVWLRVRDNGTGIDQAHQAHIFEPLYTTKMRGLGMGLAISRDIIQRHKGRMTMQSEPEQGTAFTLWLPIKTHCERMSS